MALPAMIFIAILAAPALGWFAHIRYAWRYQPSYICKGYFTPVWADCFKNQTYINQLLKKNASRHNLDWLFARAILIKESHYIDDAVSGAGAVGLMQLMPRKGSLITRNYQYFMRARKMKRDQHGHRWYKGKTARDWGKDYQQKDLWKLIQLYKDSPAKLYQHDRRFDPAWNIQSGVAQLARDYKHFLKRGHNHYYALAYTAAAYNAGPGAVIASKANRRHDRIPVNRQTEYYTASVLRLYKALQAGNGRVYWKHKNALVN